MKQPRNLRDVRWLASLTQVLLQAEPGQPMFAPMFRIDPSRNVLSARLTADGRCLFTVDSQHTIRRWDSQGARQAWEVPLTRLGTSPRVEWSADFDRAAVWSSDGGCHGVVDRQGLFFDSMPDLAGPLLGMTAAPVSSPIDCLAIFPNGVIAGRGPNGLNWQSNGAVDSVAVSMLANSHHVAVLGRSSGLLVFSSTDGRLIRKYPAPVTSPQSLMAISPDENHIASVGDQGNVILWNLSTGEANRAEIGPECSPTAIAISPLGDAVIVGDRNGRLHVWHLNTGRYVLQIPEFNGAIEQILFPPQSPWPNILVRDGREFQGFRFSVGDVPR